MAIESRIQVILKRYEIQNSNFQKVWDFYIKFYTTWLTINLLGLGLVIQHVNADTRWPIVAAFTIQNLFTAATGFMISKHSLECSKDLKHIYERALSEVTNAEGEFNDLARSPLPTQLATWGGIANGISCIALAICWIAVHFVVKSPVQSV